jgi:hypothetical protein
MRRGFDDVAAVEERLASVAGALVPYRDVSLGRQTFGLHVRDCWGGLLRARQLRWVDFGPDGFDLAEYEHYDSPLNADLHEVVPGKLIAMRGPRDVKGGALWADVLRQDRGFSHREFSPAHSVDALTQFDVRVVVRLNAPGYDARPLREAGIAVADLVFEDCTPPSTEIVSRFMRIVDRAAGMIEVARLHAAESGLTIDYRCGDAEQLLADSLHSFDVVCCMEMLEHVPDPAAMLATLAQWVKPGGELFVSTLNRNAKAFALAIVGAEYVLRLLPRGTHEYAR